MAKKPARANDDTATPKTTRAPAARQRAAQTPEPGPSPIGRTFDAVPDRVDIRDWFYQPTLAALPPKIVNCDRIPLILNQGQEGACTGFALAAVINYLTTAPAGSVSPRMIYEMARRYDEWPGEKYEGSSARGAMKGWLRHGVCARDHWPDHEKGAEHFTPERADMARAVPGGAFFRVMHRQIRDMHAALAEVGALYMTLMVHDGWQNPTELRKIEWTENGKKLSRKLPVIKRKNRAQSGHAVAIVGYTESGFIIQNSWGEAWGADGFALLPYEDYLLHSVDVWVAQVGVPVAIDIWQDADATDTTAGIQRAQAAIPLADIRPYTIDIGNNGKLSDSGNYWTTKEDIVRLFTQIIPEKTRDWKKKRVLFYLHGGLNSEAEVARRVIAYRDVMLANEIYPVHIMWESGLMETVRSLIADLTEVDARAGSVAEWLRKVREGLLEAKDWTLEMTAAAPGTVLWQEMKENAQKASAAPLGGMTIIAETVAAALAGVSPAERKKWELHVVGHSAGSIFAAHAVDLFIGAGVAFKTLQFMAPAITVEEFRRTMLPAIEAETCPVPDLYVLSDAGERDDDVGPYGKSLLFLISNAFENARATPLLGMQRFLTTLEPALPDRPEPDIEALFEGRLIVAGAGGPSPADPIDEKFPATRSDSHGGFDNDAATMNSLLWRILGHAPSKDRYFTARDLQF
jgi:hypothetical protein